MSPAFTFIFTSSWDFPGFIYINSNLNYTTEDFTSLQFIVWSDKMKQIKYAPLHKSGV